MPSRGRPYRDLRRKGCAAKYVCIFTQVARELSFLDEEVSIVTPQSFPLFTCLFNFGDSMFVPAS